MEGGEQIVELIGLIKPGSCDNRAIRRTTAIRRPPTGENMGDSIVVDQFSRIRRLVVLTRRCPRLDQHDFFRLSLVSTLLQPWNPFLGLASLGLPRARA